MAKDSPRGINTIFKQTSSALKATKQTVVSSKINRNIPYLRKISPKGLIEKISRRNKVNINFKLGQKLSKFSKKVK